MKEGWQSIPKEESNGYGGIRRERTLDEGLQCAQSQRDQKKHGMTRRGFLRGALGAGATMAAGSVLMKSGNEPSLQEEQVKTVASENLQESAETMPNSEAFEAERLGWQKWWELQYDQVLFVDELGVPIGEPVDFEKFVVKRMRTNENGDPEEFDYLLTPGALDKDGMLTGNIAGEWRRYVEARHARENNISTEEIEQRNITEEFERAARRTGEPELREQILDAVHGGNGIETMVDLVRYYGMNTEKSVRGDEKGRTRAEYLKQEITFHNRLPQGVQDELRGFIVGLAAQESRFNAGLPKNSATAEGILQLVDAVRKEHGHNPEKRLSFVEEVDVAGKHFSNIYKRLRFWMKHDIAKDSEGKRIKKDTYNVARELFPEGRRGDQLWEKYFLVPCMINAYNAGSWTIGACLHEFVADHTAEELQEMAGENPGYDLFQKFTHFAKENSANKYTANYGEDAQAYFISIAGATEALKNDEESEIYHIARAQ